MWSTHQNELWDSFLKEWTVSGIETMSIEEYTKVGLKNSFTYCKLGKKKL